MEIAKFLLPMVAALLGIIQTTSEYGVWNPARRPKIMGDIIPLRALGTHRRKIQQKIVLYHNFFRSSVQPSASNMLKMKWHNGAARSAQLWANACQLLIHDDITGRHVDGYGACGQNIFIATHKVPWWFAVKTWWLEKDDYTYGKYDNRSLTGHYLQMVWAATHQIGCGIAKCIHYAGNTPEKNDKGRVYYNYVCNYCPTGNRPGQLSNPYKIGDSCGRCKRHCRGKLCLNGCHASDLWSNCRQLHKAHPHWLCHSNTPEGRQRHLYCRATCTCKRKIHD
ncbi:hypothetical protein NQ318_015203 [Aromia moschata]|uniref:SCP domain-containing protein n=1 Tax=Aromia moschata TaxID=1265417 RepID=A0AAV8XL27_9CUCU|nr:hypothetical protein NQ318_015203 [Aromia moschata]